MADTPLTTLDDFIALALGKDRYLVRSDRFQATITIPYLLRATYAGSTGTRLSLACNEVVLPPKTLRTSTLRINALDEYRAHTATYGSDTVSMQFYVDATWEAKAFFHDWISLAISDPVERKVGFYNDYASSLTITSLSPDNTPLYEVTLQEVFPTTIQTQSLSYYFSDRVLHLGVEFAFKYWTHTTFTPKLQPSVTPDTPATLPAIELNPANDIRKLV